MPVTREQAQMLTTLAIACRPYRAPTWDEAGVMAAIAKVNTRALPEVALAVIRAAADREVTSPGVIPSNGSHWNEQLKAPRVEVSAMDPSRRCSTCDHPELEHTRLWDGEHPFEPRGKDHGIDVPRAVQALKELAHTDPEPPPVRPTSTKGTEHVAPIRAVLAKEDA